MIATQRVDLGRLVVTVRELTVAEVRAWMLLAETSSVDPLRALVFDGFGLDDLVRLCDVDASELEAFSPSELAPLVTVCKELNPHFFRVRAALSSVARMMLAESAQRPSTETAAGS